MPDLFDDRLGEARIAPTAKWMPAQIVDDDPGAAVGELQRMAAAHAPPAPVTTMTSPSKLSLLIRPPIRLRKRPHGVTAHGTPAPRSGTVPPRDTECHVSHTGTGTKSVLIVGDRGAERDGVIATTIEGVG